MCLKQVIWYIHVQYTRNIKKHLLLSKLLYIIQYLSAICYGACLEC